MFVTKAEVKMHKKNQNKESVSVCFKFRQGKCDLPPNRCWYRHTKEKDKHVGAHEKTPPFDPLVFPQVLSQIKPPDSRMEELETIMNQAMTMIQSVAKTLDEMKN